jgi:hypothetical protein
VAVSGKRPARGASPRRPHSTSSSGLKDDAGSARLEREKEAVAKIQERPGITAAELANAMGLSRNYLYRVLPRIDQVAKRGTGYYPAGDVAAHR